ncbi:FAD-dependent oxidoreductase [Microbacterium sp. ZXX196]|uniref:flavin monoamine oxidase family protein n=1 Tax=Microbacterium sp. ZXX196 TaxID=2609291 RepID=UPI0012B7EA40|nr:FAD-dependent oxidoreductase [Microbacterium sp. ZXX196]MTE24679.1 FAD-dependent oxidoreductase [Microbacterium sp. ZXX196]
MRFTRRTLLRGAGAGALAVLLASCTPRTTDPDPSASATPSATPTPVGEVPAAAAFVRSQWATDPFAWGSRVTRPVGATDADLRTLAEPVAERVFFAGDATDPDRPGTVAGARASGERVAIDLSAFATTDERVAVIGAGIAGATAARTLADAGYDVTVIEARHAAGGRLSTAADEDWPVPPQRGAWLFGAEDAGVTTEMALGGATFATVAASAARGAAGEETFSDGTVVAEAIAEASGAPTDVALADAIAETGVPDSDALGAYLAWLSALTGIDPETASTWFAPELPGGEFEAATADVSAVVSDPLDGLTVTYSTPVSGVIYDDTGVSLRLATGEALTFDRVVVTVPIGVLQTDAIAFDPPLPFAHRGAISALEMGAIEVVWLRFDEPFWETEAGLWHVVGPLTPEETASPTPTPTPGAEAAVDRTIRSWVNLMPATGEPILVGIVGGPAARAVADLGDDELLTLAAESLAPFVGA